MNISGYATKIYLDNTINTHENFVTLTVNQTTTVEDIIKLIIQTTNLDTGNDEYGVCLKNNTNIMLNTDSKVINFQDKPLLFRRTILTLPVIIEEKNRTEVFGFDPTVNIGHIINFIQLNDFYGTIYDRNVVIPNKTPNYELYLVTNTENLEKLSGIKLEFLRTLASYRCSSSDLLILKEATAKRGWDKLKNTEEIPVIISCEDFNLQKAFKFPISATFGEVLEKFIEKCNITVLTRFYGLYIDLGADQLMEKDEPLSSFPLPTPARLKCKPILTTPRPLFGVDPSQLPMTMDMGIEVPEILVILKEMLYSVNAITQEGIFRKAGVESEMRTIVKKLNSGVPVQCDNPHTIATILKRWFKKLPKRLFSHLKSEILKDTERCLNIYDELQSDIEIRLTKWLFELLNEVAKEQEINKMTASNLGIVIGPGMVGSSKDKAVDVTSNISTLSAFKGFDETKVGVKLITLNVENHLNNPDQLPLRPVIQSYESNDNDYFNSPSSGGGGSFQPPQNMLFMGAIAQQILLQKKKLNKNDNNSNNNSNNNNNNNNTNNLKNNNNKRGRGRGAGRGRGRGAGRGRGRGGKTSSPSTTGNIGGRKSSAPPNVKRKVSNDSSDNNNNNNKGFGLNLSSMNDELNKKLAKRKTMEYKNTTALLNQMEREEAKHAPLIKKSSSKKFGNLNNSSNDSVTINNNYQNNDNNNNNNNNNTKKSVVLSPRKGPRPVPPPKKKPVSNEPGPILIKRSNIEPSPRSQRRAPPSRKNDQIPLTRSKSSGSGITRTLKKKKSPSHGSGLVLNHIQKSNECLIEGQNGSKINSKFNPSVYGPAPTLDINNDRPLNLSADSVTQKQKKKNYRQSCHVFTNQVTSPRKNKIMTSPRKILSPRNKQKPHPSLPSKPKPSLPSKPKPSLPSKPKPALPSKPKPAIPSKPKPTLPSKPKPTLPSRPKPTFEF